jgi:hypothetical protein
MADVTTNCFMEILVLLWVRTTRLNTMVANRDVSIKNNGGKTLFDAIPGALQGMI